jgi:hypothetical protein
LFQDGTSKTRMDLQMLTEGEPQCMGC